MARMVWTSPSAMSSETTRTSRPSWPRNPASGCPLTRPTASPRRPGAQATFRTGALAERSARGRTAAVHRTQERLGLPAAVGVGDYVGREQADESVGVPLADEAQLDTPSPRRPPRMASWPSKAHHECIACRFEWRFNRGDLDALLASTHPASLAWAPGATSPGTSGGPRAIMGPWEEAPWLRRSGAASWS